jgi:aryl-alcohol dehydrogenase-like predicted oxidoreductase
VAPADSAKAYDASAQHIRRLVRHALDVGVNFIDTAPSYARSETLLGQALEGVARDTYILCTKFQPHARDGSLRPASELRDSLESSLQALRTDCIDLFYLHGIGPHAYASVIQAYLPELHAARSAGKIRWIGIIERCQQDHAHAALCRAIEEGHFDALMVGLNLMSPAAALSVLPAAQAANIGVVVMCAVRSVLVQPELVRQYLAAWERDGLLQPGAVSHAEPFAWLLDAQTPSVTDAAYKFAAVHPAVGSVLTGTGRLEHFEANVRAIAGPPLPSEKVQRLLDVFGPVQRNVQPDGR